MIMDVEVELYRSSRGVYDTLTKPHVKSFWMRDCLWEKSWLLGKEKKVG